MRIPVFIAVACLASFAFGCSETGVVLGATETDPDGGGPRPLAATSVAAGSEHTCALFSSQLACWGANTDGQLGIGNFQDQLRPVTVALAGVRQMTAGESHTCALDELGAVYCWGRNDRGQLGVGNREPSAAPARVALPGRAVSVAAGFNHTCVILEDAELWCFGQNGEGELGQGDSFPGDDIDAQRSVDALTPVRVPGAYREVDGGQGHTCAIQTDGSLWCWGRNTQKQLGFDGKVQVREPQRVQSDTDWQNLEAGMQYTCGLRSNRALWCWGENTGEGNLGIDVDIAPAPMRVGVGAWLSVATSIFHSCAIEASFALYCFGRNVEGQLGVGDDEVRRTPALAGSGYASVATGGFHTCAVRRDGSVLCTGKAERGQLGQGNEERSAVFVPIEPP